jgi:hypothetical protein
MAETETCEECAKFEAERIARFTEYLQARDILTLTAKKNPAHHQRALDLRRAIGRYREASKQERLHRQSCVAQKALLKQMESSHR